MGELIQREIPILTCPILLINALADIFKDAFVPRITTKHKKTLGKTNHPRIQRKKRVRKAKIANSHLCIRTFLHSLCVIFFCETSIPLVAASGSDQLPLNHLPEMLGTTPAHGASNMSHVANFGLYSPYSIMEFVSRHAVVVATIVIPIGTILAMFACMMPGPNDRASVTRDPPRFDPAHEERYSFRTYSRDVMLWSIYNYNLNPAMKVAAVALQLRGSARRLADSIPPDALVHGVVVNGVQIDPMTNLMHRLAERFGQLGEEMQLSAFSDFMEFTSRSNEGIEDLLIRFDTTRQRAMETGQLNMNIQGIVWILFRALRLSTEQFTNLLQPLQGRLPQTEQEYDELRLRIRRLGHIIERNPGNIASTLGVNSRNNNNTRAFFGQQNDQAAQEGQIGTDRPAYFGGYGHVAEDPDRERYDQTYAYQTQDYEFESGTDSDTASSNGETDYRDMIPPGMPESEHTAHLFWSYSRAKSAWRSHTRKPVRKVRRFIRRKGKGKGKGKSYGKSASAFFAEATDEEIEEIFFGKGKGKSKGKGKRTTGMGFGRKNNPKGRDGNVMKCHECDSEEHLVANCPVRRNKGKGKGNSSVNLVADYSHGQQQHQQHWFAQAETSQPDEGGSGPLDDYLESSMAHVFMMNIAPLETQDETPRDNNGAASSDWNNIPTDSSYTIPSSNSPNEEIRVSEEGGGPNGQPRPRVPNIWTQHFNQLANQGISTFHHNNNSYTGQQLPIGPPSILGGQYTLQENHQPPIPKSQPIPKAPPLSLQQQTSPPPPFVGLEFPIQPPPINVFPRYGSDSIIANPIASPTAAMARRENALDTQVIPAIAETTTVGAPQDNQGARGSNEHPDREVRLRDETGRQMIVTVAPQTGPIIPEWANAPEFGYLTGRPTPTLPWIPIPTRSNRSSLDSIAVMDLNPIAQVHFDLAVAQASSSSVTVPYVPQPSRRQNVYNLDHEHTTDLDGFRYVQHNAEAYRQARLAKGYDKGKGKGKSSAKGKSKSAGLARERIEQWQTHDHERGQDFERDQLFDEQVDAMNQELRDPPEWFDEDGNQLGPEYNDEYENEGSFTSQHVQCSLCIVNFQQGESVSRLQCGHIFHNACWINALRTPGYQNRWLTTCPICRSNRIRIVATWLYVTPHEEDDGDDRDQPGYESDTSANNAQHFDIANDGIPTEQITTPHPSTPSGSSFNTPRTPDTHVFPWWRVSKCGKYYLSVRLPNGLSIIVDPGAYTNLAGIKWVKEQADIAKQNKHASKQQKMKTPLGVSGVGKGSQKCIWQGTLPIAVEGEYPSGSGVNIQSFECPIVEGEGGEDLPALLGLKSMSDKNAILEMTPGKESLIFPGPGGYEIKLAPGYTRIPLQKAPSGHLCIPTDNFNAQSTSSSSSSSSAGLPNQHLTLHARLEE